MTDRMNEEWAREIAGPGKYPKEMDGVSDYWEAVGYLQALEDERAKAKGLVEALESIVSHQKFVGGRLSDISTIKLLAERALARYKGKK